MKIVNALITLLVLTSLTACQSNRPKPVVIESQPVLPPDHLFADCQPNYGNHSISDVITGLTELVDCERARKKAIQAYLIQSSQP